MTLREVSCKLHPAALRAVLLHRPDAHPIWHSYVVSLVHLRPVPDGPPPVLAVPDATHELAIFALSPSSDPDPDELDTLRPLMPANLFHQLRGCSDEVALALFGAFVQALTNGELSPDTDYRRHQLAWLERWGRAS